jgi:hypothetical protein
LSATAWVASGVCGLSTNPRALCSSHDDSAENRFESRCHNVTDVRAAPSETDESLSSNTLEDRSVLCVGMSATARRASGVGALSTNSRDLCRPTSDVDPADSRFATITMFALQRLHQYALFGLLL